MPELASVDRDIIFETNDVGEAFIGGIDGKRTFFDVLGYVVEKNQWFQNIQAIGQSKGLASDSYHEEFLALYRAKYDFLSYFMTLWRTNVVGLKLSGFPEFLEYFTCNKLLPKTADHVITYRGIISGGEQGSAQQELNPAILDNLLAEVTVEIEFLLQKGFLIPVRL
ncbi:MAG: hypothetical protein AB1767_06075 [Bacillota bacterium]